MLFNQEGHSAQKLPDKAMPFWNLHKKFQLPIAMGLRDLDLQSTLRMCIERLDKSCICFYPV